MPHLHLMLHQLSSYKKRTRLTSQTGAALPMIAIHTISFPSAGERK